MNYTYAQIVIMNGKGYQMKNILKNIVHILLGFLKHLSIVIIIIISRNKNKNKNRSVSNMNLGKLGLFLLLPSLSLVKFVIIILSCWS